MAYSANKLAYLKPHLEKIEFDEDVILTSGCPGHDGCPTCDGSDGSFAASSGVEITVTP